MIVRIGVVDQHQTRIWSGDSSVRITGGPITTVEGGPVTVRVLAQELQETVTILHQEPSVEFVPPQEALKFFPGSGIAVAGSVRCFCGDFTYLQNQVTIGTLPAGYLILSSMIEITTAWNDPDATVSLGSISDPTALLNGTNPAMLQVCPDRVEKFRNQCPSDLGGGGSDVTVSIDSANATAGAGRAIVFAVACS